MVKPYFERWFHGFDVFYKPEYLYWNLCSIKRNLHECVYLFLGFFERGRKGYAKRDLYNFDMYLAGVISGGLEEYLKWHHGYPCLHQKEECNCEEEFRMALENMIEGFRSVNQLEEPLDRDEYDNVKLKIDKGLELFQKYFNNLWD